MFFKSSWMRDVLPRFEKRTAMISSGYSLRFGIGVLWMIVLGLGLSLVPARVAAHHEIEEAKDRIEQSIRKTFDAFNKGDYKTFADGWTDFGFMKKTMFSLDVDRPFAKDTLSLHFLPIKLRGPIQVLSISNIRVLDHMMARATVQLDIVQGKVRERYGLNMVKRLGIDRHHKIDGDVLLPLYPKGFPVIELKMREFAFELDKSRLAKNMVLKLVNTGKLKHEFMVFKKRPEDVEHFIARAAWFLRPGQATNLVLTRLEPGDYAMVCCNTEVGGDRPHCAKGMRVEFTIK